MSDTSPSPPTLHRTTQSASAAYIAYTIAISIVYVGERRRVARERNQIAWRGAQLTLPRRGLPDIAPAQRTLRSHWPASPTCHCSHLAP